MNIKNDIKKNNVVLLVIPNEKFNNTFKIDMR